MSMKIHETAVSLQLAPATNIVVCEVIGKLSKQDYEEFAPLLEQAISEHGKVRLLFLMTDFEGWEAGALWEDLKFDFKHFNDLERIALVGDKKWEQGMALFCKPFTAARVKYFDRADLADAERWIQE